MYTDLSGCQWMRPLLLGARLSPVRSNYVLVQLRAAATCGPRGPRARRRGRRGHTGADADAAAAARIPPHLAGLAVGLVVGFYELAKTVWK